MSETNRRKFIGGGAAAAAAATVAAVPAEAQTKKVIYPDGNEPDGTPLYVPALTYGNLVFVSGVGAHVPGDIRVHTKIVLDEIKKRLDAAGSSVEKVLKINVYLNDLDDYGAMNETFRGFFGDRPGVRTTIAAAGGIPGDSLVEIDVIAHL